MSCAPTLYVLTYHESHSILPELILDRLNTSQLVVESEMGRTQQKRGSGKSRNEAKGKVHASSSYHELIFNSSNIRLNLRTNLQYEEIAKNAVEPKVFSVIFSSLCSLENFTTCLICTCLLLDSER